MDYKVYVLRCPLSNEVRYVGITSQDPQKRFKNHLHEKFDNAKTRWFKDLKEQNKQPILEIVKANLSFAGAHKVEQELIAKYNKDNLLTNSIINGKNKNPVGDAKRFRAVLQFDLKGNLINKFESMMAAARSLQKNKANGIVGCCAGKRKTAYGYVWKYEGPKLDLKSFVNKKNLVGQFTVDNKCLAVYNDVPTASLITGVDSSDIYKCCKGKRKTVSNYVWKYISL